MQFIQFTAARADTGQVLPSATATVYLSGTSTKAALFDANGNPIANPAVGSGVGLIGFAAANGTYDVAIQSADGVYSSPGMTKVQLYDLAAFTGQSATTRTALAGTVGPSNGQTLYLAESGREGAFVFRTGNYSSQVASDPNQGLYVPQSSNSSGSAGAWVRVRDGDYGRPEWFGAIVNSASAASTNLAALQACHALCQDTLLSTGAYYISDTLKWTLSDRRLFGRAMGYGTTTSSRITITGTNAASNTIFQFGADSYAAVARGQFCSDVAFDRNATASASPTGDAEDCVKGVLYRWTTNSEMRRCRVFNSPVGVHVTMTATSNLVDVNVAPATGTGAVFSIGFLLGGYTTYPGFVGSNGSLRVEGCTAFGFPAATYSAHTLIYGMPADTWLDKCEGSSGKNGIDVCGLTKAAMITYLANGASGGAQLAGGGSTQDITISNCRMDGFSGVANYYHDLNGSASLNVANPYVASSGTAFAVSQISGGRVNIEGGEALASTATQGGCDVASVGLFRMVGTFLRDFAIPGRISNCIGAEFAPQILNQSTATGAAVQLINTDRCIIQPAVHGNAGKFTSGITLDSASGYNKIDGSLIDPGCFVTVDAAYKVRYNGADAKPGGSGNAAFVAAGNALTGVTG